MERFAALLVVLAFASPALAADPPWPPTPEAQERIDHLRHILGDPTVTPAERQVARDELARLLMHPSRAPTPVGRMPPRAAVMPKEPLPPPVVPPPPATAIVTPVAPAVRAPHPVPDGKGGNVVPGGQTAIDPKTGATLIDVGNGWLDPATGRFVPKQ